MSDANQQKEDILAGEYVLGTLQGKERDSFEKQLQLDPSLRKKVNHWENRFYPMLDSTEPVMPPKNVWDVIENRINPGERVKPSSFWDSLAFWRNFGLVTSTLLVAITIQIFQPNHEPVSADRMMVVLNDQARAGWIVAAHQENSFRVQAIQPTPLPKGKVCQLWMQTSDNQLLPLGILPHTGVKTLESPMVIPKKAKYKVSIEALNDLPREKPKGVVVFEGELISI